VAVKRTAAQFSFPFPIRATMLLKINTLWITKDEPAFCRPKYPCWFRTSNDLEYAINCPHPKVVVAFRIFPEPIEYIFKKAPFLLCYLLLAIYPIKPIAVGANFQRVGTCAAGLACGTSHL
jgi:hypothetical protein